MRITHVRSHVGTPGNELADRIADRAMKNANEIKNAQSIMRRPFIRKIDLQCGRANRCVQ